MAILADCKIFSRKFFKVAENNGSPYSMASVNSPPGSGSTGWLIQGALKNWGLWCGILIAGRWKNQGRTPRTVCLWAWPR